MLDAASLTLGEGLEVLLSRKFDRLLPGEILEVHSDDPSIEHDLRAWARFTAHEWKGMRVENGRFVCSIKRGTAQRIITTDPSVWLEAKRETGFAPRGAIVRSSNASASS
jgi:TusA-related sulfurtransferase